MEHVVKTYNPQTIDLINAMLQEKFEVSADKLTPQARLKEDLSLDSLDFVEMFVILESKTGSTVKDVDFLNIRTLGDIYELVSNLEVSHSRTPN